MNKYVNAISGRLSLRPPQRRALEILDRIAEIVPPGKGVDRDAALVAIQAEFPTVTDFERDFVSLCFALATGVGKTRLMGAFIAYLHLAHRVNNFFVLAPNLTIYEKLVTDFTPNTAKYVFKGIAEFAAYPPEVVTGDNYEQRVAHIQRGLLSSVVINVFNISKINADVRSEGNSGRPPRVKRLSEYLGESYFAYLAGLDDLVLLMDESHRYRASAGVRVINELKPILGLELTGTPFVDTGRTAIPFRNVIFDYPLAHAMEDGFVKEPAVVTRANFNPASMSAIELEDTKLRDGIRLHESIKVQLETYARNSGKPLVKPFVLVIARDTTHASQLVENIRSATFFNGRYEDRVVQVDSSRTGAAEDEMVERLLKIESPEEQTEIVVHVNMLKEGWDVNNLYTIVPLRAANARVLVEQSIGRGLRLPYGKRTGVAALDRLNIVAHDRFQEIVDLANQPDSPFRMQQVILATESSTERSRTVVSQPELATKLGLAPPHHAHESVVVADRTSPSFPTGRERDVAKIAYGIIRALESRPDRVPSTAALLSDDVQELIRNRVVAEYLPPQMDLDGIDEPLDIRAIVSKTAELVVRETIDIPRILVVPEEGVRSGFKRFELDLTSVNYPPPSDDLWIRHLRSNHSEVLGLASASIEEQRVEDYLVRGLVEFDDVAYDDQSTLLYELAGQVLGHLRSYLSESDVARVVGVYRGDLCRLIHAQMQDHFWETATGYETIVSKGFTELKPSAYTLTDHDEVLDVRRAPPEKGSMSRYLFGGFRRCLYAVQKFDSDAERVLALILDRDALKWFRPAKEQFHIYYLVGGEQAQYQPDFVAETEDLVVMIEVKARRDLGAPDVVEKRNAALKWCERASDYAVCVGGKAWQYVLVPHDIIAENMTLAALTGRYGASELVRPISSAAGRA